MNPQAKSLISLRTAPLATRSEEVAQNNSQLLPRPILQPGGIQPVQGPCVTALAAPDFHQADSQRPAPFACRLCQVLGFASRTPRHVTTLSGQLPLRADQVPTDLRAADPLCMPLHRLSAPLRRRAASVNVGAPRFARSAGGQCSIGFVHRKRRTRTKEQGLSGVRGSSLVGASQSTKARHSPARVPAASQRFRTRRAPVRSQRTAVVRLSGRCCALRNNAR